MSKGGPSLAAVHNTRVHTVLKIAQPSIKKLKDGAVVEYDVSQFLDTTSCVLYLGRMRTWGLEG
jgi:hypothetical protein